MRVLALIGLCLVFLSCCGCNALYQVALFKQWFGHDDDDVDYIPFHGSWSGVSLLSGTRAAACAGIDDKIYVCGGEDAGGALDTVELYDTAGDSWTPLASLGAPASGHVCVSLGGKVYAFGGTGISAAYDPASDLWSAVAAPQATFHAAAAACSGKIYCFGGSLSSGYTYATTQVYDPALDSWTEAASMPESRAGAFCAAVDGKIYVAGGYHNPPGGPTDSYADSVFEYDPGTDSWTVRATAMSHPRAYGCCGVVNGRMVLIGGFDGNYPGLDWVEAYDPAQNTWLNLNREPSARCFTCGSAVGTRIYIFGGRIGVASFSALAREFISP